MYLYKSNIRFVEILFEFIDTPCKHLINHFLCKSSIAHVGFIMFAPIILPGTWHSVLYFFNIEKLLKAIYSMVIFKLTICLKTIIDKQN